MSTPFDAYTAYYDLLYRDKDYAGEVAYLADHLAQRQPGARRLLELGCGTGAHAVLLAERGFHVHGVDLSPTMLERAQARRAALPAEVAQRLSFSLGDARSVRVDGGRAGPFDAVLSLFHVMSYQTTNADLAAVYETARAHLAPGGLFLHDYWYGPAVLTQQPATRVRRLSSEQVQVTRIAEPLMRTADNVCEVHYTLFVQGLEQGAAGPIEQIRECHPMRYLFLPELALIEGAHWHDAQDRAWLQASAPAPEHWAALRSTRRA